MENNAPEINVTNASEEVNEMTEIPYAKEGKKKNKKADKKTPPKMSDQLKKLKKTIKLQTAWLVILSMLFVCLCGLTFADSIKFQWAKILISNGNIEKGVGLLNSIEDHQGAAKLLDKYKFTVVGNIVKFGKYEQDADMGNGQEPLEWVVLDYDHDEQKALIITLYAIDCIQYMDGYGAVTWENSDARAWLNKNFIRTAFKGNELGRILESDIETPNNLKYKTKGGNITADKVFLLSDAEFKKYLDKTDFSIGYTTQYSLERGVQSGPISGTSVCWLRTPGESLVYVSTVSYVGELNSKGVYSYSSSCGIRPAMWIDVNSK